MIEEVLLRIAVALEAIVESQGIVAGTVRHGTYEPQEPQEELDLDVDDDDDDLDDMNDDDLDDDLDDDDLDDEPAPVAKKKKKKKTAKRKAKKKTQKKTQIGKDDNPKSKYSADEVREKMKDLQLATGSAAQVKSILKRHGASTFGQLDVSKYDKVVADVEKLLE